MIEASLHDARSKGLVNEDVPVDAIAHLMHLMLVGNIVVRALDMPAPSREHILAGLTLLGDGVLTAEGRTT